MYPTSDVSGGAPPPEQPVTLLSLDLEATALGSMDAPVREEEGGASALLEAVKYGLRSHVARMLENASPDTVMAYTPQGHTLLHWAAKKGDADMIELLIKHGANPRAPTKDDNRMAPIHWAAAEGHLRALRVLLELPVDVNSCDALNCTPLIITAQHGHATCAAFLLRHGADPAATDVNGDAALHWAAYKGHVELVSLLAYETPQAVSTADSYGQTPLHLAAMRGHLNAVEFLVRLLHAPLGVEDKSGETAADLARRRGKLNCELFLRTAASRAAPWAVARALGFKRALSSKVLFLILVGKNDREVFRWPFRVVVLSLAIGVVFTAHFIAHPGMADLTLLHACNVLLQAVAWTSLLMTRCCDPGRVDKGDPRHSTAEYEEALEEISRAQKEEDVPLVCHTCRVRRPLRSKHCKVTNQCVLAFDHFCPFVGNVVAHHTYKWFVAFCFAMAAAFLFQIPTCVLYMRRIEASWSIVLWVLYCLAWLIADMGLISYHCQLMIHNLTTNEHMNMARYAYMRDQYGLLNNPFDRGFFHNVMERLFPPSQLFYSREEVLQARGPTRRAAGGSYTGLQQHDEESAA